MAAEQIMAPFRELIAKTAPCVARIRCGENDTVRGTIVGPDGWVLTKASELKGRAVVRLHDGRDLEATTVGVNRKIDLAMFKIDATHLPAVPQHDAALCPSDCGVPPC